MTLTDPAVTPELVAKHGLTPEEFERIRKILGRDPNFTELGIFSVMWSEHCSYKNSRLELKKFPTSGRGILVKAGEENAGVVDIGDGWAVAFKMESHNHPSAVEPFQGAATGVGGIIRDIFTMGARPEFCLNSLRFGPITSIKSEIGNRKSEIANNRRLFAGVVSGIAHYGNCIGIPTIGGEIYFDESFEGNPLVNVFCLGVLRHDQVARGAARGAGNPVFYVGAETGRDGLAGAAFASRELTEESKEDRPAVQVGDPFKEKLLLEACLELLATDAVAGIQDMGAAGLTCSTCETASRGGSGVEIDLAKVPKRESGMTPYEILLSESQERMLIIARRGREDVVRDIFAKWEVPCEQIGEVTEDGMMRVLNNGEVVAEIPGKPLSRRKLRFIRGTRDPPSPVAAVDRRMNQLPAIDLEKALEQLLSDPTIASKNWVYRQYDHTVRTGTMVAPGSDAAVFYVRYADKILAATSDCNSLFCALDPREGARHAVAEAARNLTCSGAQPLAVTDNLNFGNPYKPENFWQLRESVEGMAEACKAFETPVVGGNVSLYNESPAGVVDPTPTVGMVGLIQQQSHVTTQWFKQSGDAIVLVAAPSALQRPSLGASRFLKVCHGRKEGPVPRLDIAQEIAVQSAIRKLIQDGLVKSAHDCSEGGIAVALAESCFNPKGRLGAECDLSHVDAESDAATLLFNEAPSRILISVDAGNVDQVLTSLKTAGVSAFNIGRVTEEIFSIKTGDRTLRCKTASLYDLWWNSISRIIGGESQGDPLPSL